jgi:oligopeptidase B
MTTTPTPPVARRIPHATTRYGETLVDDYYWLRDREDPATICYLEAENAYAEAAMAHTQALQAQLYQELRGRIKETDLLAPERRDDVYYYTRTEEGRWAPATRAPPAASTS